MVIDGYNDTREANSIPELAQRVPIERHDLEVDAEPHSMSESESGSGSGSWSRTCRQLALRTLVLPSPIRTVSPDRQCQVQVLKRCFLHRVQ